jgi:hypothetical protein
MRFRHVNVGDRMRLSIPRSRRHAWLYALMVKLMRAFFFPRAAPEYLSEGSCVRPPSESGLRRTTEALLDSSKPSRELRAYNLFFRSETSPQAQARQRGGATLSDLPRQRGFHPFDGDRQAIRITGDCELRSTAPVSARTRPANAAGDGQRRCPARGSNQNRHFARGADGVGQRGLSKA